MKGFIGICGNEILEKDYTRKSDRINAGAPATEDIHDLQPKPEILRLLEVVSKQTELAR